jgi:hypothetical protein
MRSGFVENTYADGHGGGVGGPVEVEVVGEEWGLGAGEAVALIASTAACGGEGGSGGEDGEETELGAGGGEERSGVQGVVDGNSCGELGKERVYVGVVMAAGVGLGGDHVGGGGECGGREMKVIATLDAPQQFHLTAPLCRLPRPLRGQRRGGRRRIGQRWLKRRRFSQRGLGPGLRCSGQQRHRSASDQTVTTRASAAASLDRGGGGWHLAGN